MPELATLKMDVRCPGCGKSLIGYARFQWGVVPGPSYQIGDEIRWIRGGDGQPLDSFLFTEVEGRHAWNCGSPSYERVLVMDDYFYDEYFYEHHANANGFTCKCKTRIGAVAIDIRRNVLVSANALLTNEVLELFGNAYRKSMMLVADDTDGWQPKTEWYDAPLIRGPQTGREFVG